jgi:hypothetical protein
MRGKTPRVPVSVGLWEEWKVESVILLAFTVLGGHCKERKEEKCILIYIHLILL